MATRLKVGVVGCGLIAQVMHLHYLRELSDRFEIAAICDLSEEVREACGGEYGVQARFATWQELLAQPLDAVLVLTSGSHAPIAIAAAQAGMHVLVEKPMCFSVAEGQAMVDAAEAAGVTLMVAYNKRYDPAYQRAVEEMGKMRDLRLAQITTLESPLEPYVQHYELRRGAPLPKQTLDALIADNQARISAAIPDADPLSRWAYHLVLLDSLVHELNAMRGLLGEPDRLEFSDIRETGLTAIFKYGAAQCIVAWVDLPGIARYSMDLAFFSPERRMTLSFPSPFLRSMPTLLVTEEGVAKSPRSSRTEEIASYNESFKEELIHFHDCVTGRRAPVTSGRDTIHDIALCEAIVAVHRTRAPRDHPSDPAASASLVRNS
ncbi:MAG TPA: Gfo/Idh/MocA family oxidoreductase [Candidatus Dormibacteraeota bacterium]|nr:Gfo/Idh/MocA family oxidoreductase [Candidatus Dormibacteraeota bacterium]